MWSKKLRPIIFSTKWYSTNDKIALLLRGLAMRVIRSASTQDNLTFSVATEVTLQLGGCKETQMEQNGF